MNRKQIKKDAATFYTNAKQEKTDLKAGFSDLSDGQRNAAIREYNEKVRRANKKRSQEIKELQGEEKKEAKLFRKYLNRKRHWYFKYIALILLLTAGIIVYGQVSPMLSEFKEIADFSVVQGTPEAQAAKNNGLEVAENITDEGLVLLENEDNLLPLTGEKRVNVFGFGAQNMKMGGGGSGGTNTTDAVSFYDGLSQAGIAYNPDLYQFYQDNSDLVKQPGESIWAQMGAAMLGKEYTSEPETTDYLSPELISSAKEYSDTALVVLTSMSTEASDATVDQLQISPEETELLNLVTSEFDNVIVLINSGYAMDLSFIEDYPSIKSVLWIGTPGALGAVSIGNVLSGEVNPSGRLNDTYVYDISSIPSTENMGNYQYTNIPGIGQLDYEEGIYVGYRYFETRYENNDEGYNSAVQYPFGYGLSYTTFDQKIISHSVSDDKINLKVKVTNTGDVAGKDVVEVYFKPPYIDGGIEKSAIELGAFEKTDIIAPGESQTVDVSFKIKDMSSWDMDNNNYRLDAGDYQIVAGKNSHDQFDSYTYTVPKTVVYDKDEDTNTLYQSHFDYANGDLTYMSRADFEGTYPTDDDVNLEASDEVVNEFDWQPTEIEGEEPIMGADNGIVLADLKGKDFDDPMWDSFLDEFTLDEMIQVVSHGGYHTRAIERLGVPRTLLLDGPAGFNAMFGPKIDSASYPSELLVASTWNKDLAYDLGDAVGKEAGVYGIDMWYAPAMNIHRSPLGGRNFEYFSEDPLVSGYMAAGMINGAQDNNLMVTIKHFILNEQEVNARSGVMVWANEQAIRELYLRPFEIANKEADPTGAMSSFINVGPIWSGGNDDLLNGVLRGEWGFDGIVTTDAQLGSWMNPVRAVLSGNELMLSAFSGDANEKMLNEAYQKMPVAISNALRDRIHTIMYNIVNHSNAVTRASEEEQ